MLCFWRNPEFVRHLRAELRPARAVRAASVALVICILLGLACWSAEHGNVQSFLRLFYGWLVGGQFVILGIWCASACGQAISRERELKTYDFLRTTRLTSGELLIGKLLGAPVMAYFVIACTVPVAIVCALLGGFGPGAVLGTCLLLVVFSLFFGLVAMWCSMLIEKSNAGAIGLAALLVNGLALRFSETAFPGLASLSVVPPILALHGFTDLPITRVPAVLFGLQIPFILATCILYVTLGAWFALMLVRNFKKEREQMRLLSRWEAVGLAAYLNLLFYAFLEPRSVVLRFAFRAIRPQDVAGLAMSWNAVILYMVGIAALTPREKLKVWWRRWSAGEESYLSDRGLPWPWLLPAAAIALAMLFADALGMTSIVPLGRWQIAQASLQLLAFLMFVTRDVMFLQWCTVTRMRRPLLKGMLYLGLYYATVGVLIVVATVVSRSGAEYLAELLTPSGVSQLDWAMQVPSHPHVAYFGLGLQVIVTYLILLAIRRRVQTVTVAPQMVPA
jgi:ABC-type transport system involved in multi-copper enzyme maturation permease subunit